MNTNKTRRNTIPAAAFSDSRVLDCDHKSSGSSVAFAFPTVAVATKFAADYNLTVRFGTFRTSDGLYVIRVAR